MKIIFSHAEMCAVIQSGLKSGYRDAAGIVVSPDEYEVVGVTVTDSLDVEVELNAMPKKAPDAD
jgi:hypothetical protein